MMRGDLRCPVSMRHPSKRGEDKSIPNLPFSKEGVRRNFTKGGEKVKYKIPPQSPFDKGGIKERHKRRSK